MARIAPPPGRDAPCHGGGLRPRSAVELLGRDPATAGSDAVAAESWAAVRAAVARCRPGAPAAALTDAEVARHRVGATRRRRARPRPGLALGDEPAVAEQLWTECTRRAPAPLDAAPATLLAVSAWLRGDGAMANVALDRAWKRRPATASPGCSRQALAACLTPSELRALLIEASAPAAG